MDDEPDVWVDLPGVDGFPDRVAMSQLNIAPHAAKVPPRAWARLLDIALREWFHTVHPREWAGVTMERTDRSKAAAPEILVCPPDERASSLLRISPRRVKKPPVAGMFRQGLR